MSRVKGVADGKGHDRGVPLRAVRPHVGTTGHNEGRTEGLPEVQVCVVEREATDQEVGDNRVTIGQTPIRSMATPERNARWEPPPHSLPAISRCYSG